VVEVGGERGPASSYLPAERRIIGASHVVVELGAGPIEPGNAARDLARLARPFLGRVAATGVDLASYDTAENASDIADLRTAMGIKEWDVYGVSYGSDLALTLLRDHPEGLRSVVVDSVVPPNLDNIMDEFWPGAAIGYKAVFDACAAQAACAAAYPDLADEFTATVNRFAKEPVTVAAQDASGAMVQLNIDGYQFANLIIVQSGAPGSFAGIPSMIDRMTMGDAGPAAKSMVNYVPAVVSAAPVCSGGRCVGSTRHRPTPPRP
jgi:pimeloyl-ACP methyl ester carboxylesterase